MYKKIEKEYKKSSEEYKFNRYYWICSFTLTLIYAVIKNFYDLRSYYILLFLTFLIIVRLIINFIKETKGKKKTIKEKIHRYLEKSNNCQKDILNDLLKKYNFKEKDEIKMMIFHFENCKSIKIESSLMSWVLTVSISIASFLEIAYDDTTNSINYSKLNVILNNTAIICIYLLLSLMILKTIIDQFSRNNNTKDSLIEDLTKIYLNKKNNNY